MNNKKKDTETLEALKLLLEQNKKEHDKETHKMVDVVFKIAVALAIGAIMWIFNTVNQVKQDVSNIKLENGYTKETFSKLDEFMNRPTFTKEDFEVAIKPMIQQLNANTEELSTRNGFKQSVTEKLMRIELRLENIENNGTIP